MRKFEVVSAFKDKDIQLPCRKTISSAGYDLQAAEDIIIQPNKLALIPTGIKAYMQQNEVLMLHIRSSIAVKKMLILANGVGVVDADYYDNPDNEGHIMVAVINLSTEPALVKKGERVAQGIFVKYLLSNGDACEDKRKGGFGSTN